MNNDLSKARQLLETGSYTCVFCRGDTLLTDNRRGILPLLDLLRSGQDLRDFSAADKVVGKAAAFLYRLMGIKALYAGVISTPALAVLKEIPVEFAAEVPAIANRSRTGFCPMETAVWDIDDPLVALAAIETTLAQMKKGTPR